MTGRCPPALFLELRLKKGDCATWNGLYLGGLGVSLLGLIQPSNRSDVAPARTISLNLGPSHLSVAATF